MSVAGARLAVSRGFVYAVPRPSSRYTGGSGPPDSAAARSSSRASSKLSLRFRRCPIPAQWRPAMQRSPGISDAIYRKQQKQEKRRPAQEDSPHCVGRLRSILIARRGCRRQSSQGWAASVPVTDFHPVPLTRRAPTYKRRTPRAPDRRP
jgi:hypothetical protein